MNRSPPFDSPLLLGFEHTRSLVERAARINGEAYPPYNVEACGEGRIRITLAVAGFTADQLSVSVEDNQLTIVGAREAETESAPERAYLHRGIAARGFVRGFVLADGVEVSGAVLEDGLLTIEAVRPPLARSVRTVPIRTVL
ncbi:MAG: heat-shock protein Hsp20 [Caulobacteraceae bacterium]|nr:heat-shock protein Hsp20 [Caulobacteraceae bacterium]